jgi:hypothetical protein
MCFFGVPPHPSSRQLLTSGIALLDQLRVAAMFAARVCSGSGPVASVFASINCSARFAWAIPCCIVETIPVRSTLSVDRFLVLLAAVQLEPLDWAFVSSVVASVRTAVLFAVVRSFLCGMAIMPPVARVIYLPDLIDPDFFQALVRPIHIPCRSFRVSER